MTCVCGFNDDKGRKDLWKDLEVLAKNMEDPWIVAEDFNDVLEKNEKEWGDEHIKELQENSVSVLRSVN